jgi:hypothetical protein
MLDVWSRSFLLQKETEILCWVTQNRRGFFQFSYSFQWWVVLRLSHREGASQLVSWFSAKGTNLCMANWISLFMSGRRVQAFFFHHLPYVIPGETYSWSCELPCNKSAYLLLFCFRDNVKKPADYRGEILSRVQSSRSHCQGIRQVSNAVLNTQLSAICCWMAQLSSCRIDESLS